MHKLWGEITRFLEEQGCVAVSSIDNKGFPHSSCKGIVKIERDGRIYLLDLYKAVTYDNIMVNPQVSITAFDEHKFKGFCLKGRAWILSKEKLDEEILKSWDDRMTSRLTKRLLKNIREGKGHLRHPEVLLPRPEYMIAVDVHEVVDLTPPLLR